MRSQIISLAVHVGAVLVAAVASAEPTSASEAEVNAWIGADTNEDGALTLREFPAFVRAMAKTGQSTAQTIEFFGAFEMAFSIADANSDGRVTPDELRSADDAHRAGE